MNTRALAVALGISVPSWAVLAVLAGNVGLQRLVSGGFERLLDQPLPMAASTATTFAVAFALGRWRPTRSNSFLPSATVWAVLLNVLAGAFAVLVVGELELDDLALTTAAISSLGFQIVAAVVGLLLGRGDTAQEAVH